MQHVGMPDYITCETISSPADSLENRLAEYITQYAEYIKTSGIYLEVLDAELCVRAHGKRLGVAVEPSSDVPITLRPSAYLWNCFLPEQDREEFVDLSSGHSDWWFILSTNGMYDPELELRNHWLMHFWNTLKLPPTLPSWRSKSNSPWL